uniref:tumor necrosis factor receptor superfamily member 5-like isoform X2 n=1 Tax=Myxine glutinosa TaxID=7769 RepID=UPI00358E72D0
MLLGQPLLLFPPKTLVQQDADACVLPLDVRRLHVSAANANGCAVERDIKKGKTTEGRTACSEVWRLRRHTCPQTSDSYEHNGECCSPCAAGKFVKRHCTSTTETDCGDCPRDTFTNDVSHLTECIRCFNCDTADGHKKVKECTPSEDSVCECAPGFFCVNKGQIGCRRCQRHSSCDNGMGLEKLGTQDEDTLCIQCKTGTFSSGGNATCLPWQNCTALGMSTTTQGTPFKDAVCASQPIPPSTPTRHYGTILVSCVVVFLVIIFILLSIWMWTRLRCHSVMGGMKWCQKKSVEDTAQVQQQEGGNDLDDRPRLPTEEVNQTLVSPENQAVPSLFLSRCVQETN